MQVWPKALFFVLTLALAVGVHVYLYRRLIRDVTARRIWRWLGAGALTLLTTGAMASRVWLRNNEEARSVALGFFIWLGIALYLLMAFVTVDAAKWLSALSPKPAPLSKERREFLATAARATAVVAGSSVAGFGVYRAFAPAEITELPIRLPGLPKALEGFTLVQLTDVHVGPVIRERFMDDLVNRANGCKPDAVVITGDLVDGSLGELGNAVARLTRLSSKFGTYFVTGNHDYYSDATLWVPALEGLGIVALRNRRAVLGDGEASFDLIGVDDWGARFGPRGYDLAAATAGRDKTRASVLLAHQPSNFEAVAKEGLGLQLSGHTHGGQMFPANYLGDVIWGSRNNGLSQLDGSQIYVSRGCGFVGPPMRVGAAPEIVKVVLLPA
ncbi:MAG: metallophosphoesterase [Myxococcaceae bacterium]|nr:metallophosphoesterase [Myxococcaceae bacterium]